MLNYDALDINDSLPDGVVHLPVFEAMDRIAMRAIAAGSGLSALRPPPGAVASSVEMTRAARGFHPSDGSHGLRRGSPRPQPRRNPGKEGSTYEPFCDQ